MSNRDCDCGDVNTLYGNVRPPETMGSDNTIVGSTDINSNKFIHCSARAGDGASLDPAIVIIGAGAGANIGKKKSKGDRGSRSALVARICRWAARLGARVNCRAP